MTDDEFSFAIAQSLARFFPFHQADWFRTYISLSCSQNVCERPAFDSLVVLESEIGDVQGGMLGSELKRYWSLDQHGWQSDAGEIKQAVADWNDAAETRREFYRHAKVKFYRQGPAITFGECFGPRLLCRKAGEVVVNREGLGIYNVELLWNGKYLNCGVFSRPPVPAISLDIGLEGPVMAAMA